MYMLTYTDLNVVFQLHPVKGWSLAYSCPSWTTVIPFIDLPVPLFWPNSTYPNWMVLT